MVYGIMGIIPLLLGQNQIVWSQKEANHYLFTTDPTRE